MKLCTCNNCGGVFEDMNPSVDQKEYPDKLRIGVHSLRMFYEQVNKPETGYWGCPVCCTDGFLQDFNGEFEIELPDPETKVFRAMEGGTDGG